jgi:replicative DNA helicase
VTTLLDPTLPANLDAERFVLGSILLNDAMYAQVAGAIEPDDFSLEKHRRIFARMKDLYDRGERLDRVTVANELMNQGQLESVDGLTYIVSLDDGLPEIVNLESYIRIVKEKATLRMTMFACQKVIQQCSQSAEPSEEILQAAEALLGRIGNRTGKQGNWVTPFDLYQQQGVSLLSPPGGTAGLETPWKRLTEMTSGWGRGDLIIVGGRPGAGKSVIGMQQAYLTARRGRGVAYVSLEMSKESLVQRLIAGISRVDSHRSRCSMLTSEERTGQVAAAAQLEGLTLFIEDTRAHTPVAIHAALRKLKAKSNVGLVVIDHLQLTRLTGRSESRHQELSEICHGFKRLASQMDCVVMLLSQLNRSCEQERRRPNLSDLKESGSIEEDADTVLFIHRPELYKRDDPSLRGQAELIVAKQRNGPTGKLPLTFLHGFQVFEEASGDIEMGG